MIAYKASRPPSRRRNNRRAEKCSEKKIIWGGIPASILCEGFSDGYVEKFVLDTLDSIYPGDKFIFAIGDMLPPNGYIHRVEMIEDLLEEHSYSPIRFST